MPAATIASIVVGNYRCKSYVQDMDVMLADQDLTPALRQVLDRAVAEAEAVRVVPVQGGYRLVALGMEPARDRSARGPIRLGLERDLGRTLGDLE